MLSLRILLKRENLGFKESMEGVMGRGAFSSLLMLCRYVVVRASTRKN